MFCTTGSKSNQTEITSKQVGYTKRVVTVNLVEHNMYIPNCERNSISRLPLALRVLSFSC
jgi:ribosomal protein L28